MADIVKERKGLPRTNNPIELPPTVTWLKQSNLVTLMSYDYKVVQIRVLVAVIEKLQSVIEVSINKQNVRPHLELFSELNSDRVSFSIPTKEFGIQASNYNTLKECLKKLATIPVEIDAKDPSGKDCWYIGGLFEAYLPKRYERSVKIVMKKDVAMMFVNVDKGFTRFMKEIACEADSKYTIRMYFLISSWKDRGGFSITIDKFKKWLNIKNKYPEFKDLYKRIIRPAYEDLFEKADCWFEVAEVYKEDQTEPYKLNFKVIKGRTTKEEQQIYDTYMRSLSRILEEHLYFDRQQSNQILKFLTTSNYAAIVNKICYLKEYIHQHNVKNRVTYCLKALKNEFSNNVPGEELEEIE